MPLYNITLKADAPVEELEKAKDTAREKGGVIRHEYSIIKGFTVEFPDDNVQSFESTEHVHVEQDGAVETQ
ncbi:Proteinase inhibitor propeptide [Penicillium coprophilum]|uniref:Proteinase inhibitor propeptide n=1 Tax=Penicillium coprophilum TaxID=36646 RepID=UPI0023A7240E|nr:Proteinase inhibitor propeptide [Penicillium coprophilum]KAJ5164078.1 Proteinase inhibitor propeptide [Penicillium coprophilum]